MPWARWIRFRRRHQGVIAPPGAIARATARGESLETILELAARGMLEVGRADRAAIWVESPAKPEEFLGTVVAAGTSLQPVEWRRVDATLPFFRMLLESQEPVTAEFGEDVEVSLIGPLAGMRSAAWLPLRVHQKPLGLALVASSARSRHSYDLVRLRWLADELAAAVAQLRELERSCARQEELASEAQILRTILHGASSSQVLPQIVREAARHTHAEFVALGWRPAAPLGALRFDSFEGPPEWAVSLAGEPFTEVWRTALDQNRVVELAGQEAMEARGLGGNPQFERLGRVVVLPLAVDGYPVAVLLAGLLRSAVPSASLSRLESAAALAAAALREEQHSARAKVVAGAYRSLLETSSEWILALDREGVIWEASRSAAERLNLDPSQPGRKRFEELFPATAREAVADWWRSAKSAADEATPPPEEVALHNGYIVRLDLRGAGQGTARGNGLTLVYLDDVTAVRRTAEEKRRTEAQLHTLLDSLDSGVLMFDVKGKVLLANDRFAQLVGLDPRRAAELGTFEALVEVIAGHFHDPLAMAARWRELFLRGDQASSDELELVTPARRVIERFARPVYGPEGEQLGWLEIYRDITGQRMIHSKLLQTEKMAGLGQLVSGITHELNNPLTTIMGFAQLLLSREASPESTGDARMIYQEAERAAHIVRNLLLFARETKPERQVVNLNEIVERTLALRSYQLKVENIAVECELDPDLPLTLAGATQMQQVVLNLVANAEQAIQQGRGYGRIRARTRRLSPQRIALEVADDGPGIPPEIVSRIFDPFFTTKPVGLGTGLGLSIVYGIVHEHGGEITVGSQPGGALFVIELPVVAASSAAAAGAEIEPAQPPAAVASADESGPGALGRRERILVVEDEPTVAQLIADVLREDGRRVETVLDSREGLERLARQAYDLVICDLKMPHLSGRGFYRALVRAGNPLQHRFILITGDTLAPHTQEFLESSGLPYLAKPFLVEELKLAVQQALNRAAGNARAAAAAGGSAGPRNTKRKL